MWFWLSSKHIVFKSWRFQASLFWTLVFTSFHKCSIGFKSGDWLRQTNSLILLLFNQLSFLCCMLRIIILLEGPPTSHLHHPGGWEKILLRNLLVKGSIHCSFNYMKSASTMRWKTAPHHNASSHGDGVHCLLFSLWQWYLLPPSVSGALSEWSLGLGLLFWLFFLAYWKIQKFWDTSVSKSIYMFRNNKVCFYPS